jgi:hypothetical protein
MDFFNNITQGLKKDLVGRHFVYKSEYGGETIGVVADVYKESVLNFDAVTEYNITKYLSEVTVKVEKPIDDKPVSAHKWAGYKFKFYVRSTNNIAYNLDEIIILRNEIDARC